VCERLELHFDQGPGLTLSAAGEEHYYGEADLLVAALKRSAAIVWLAFLGRGFIEQAKYWWYEPRGVNPWSPKYLMQVEFRWATGSFSAGYLVTRPGQPLAIDLEALHCSAVWLDGEAEGLAQGTL
jgi:hypothetical protein